MTTRLTVRLRLEPIGLQHEEDLHRVHRDPAVAEVYGTWTTTTAEREATRFAAGWDVDGVSKWIAYDRTTHELVGRGGLSRVPVDGAERLEVGWAVLGRFWGNGYATEIGRAALSFAFEDLGEAEVVAFTEPHNLRSRAVMERLAMTYRRDITHDDTRFVLYSTRHLPPPDRPGQRSSGASGSTGGS